MEFIVRSGNSQWPWSGVWLVVERTANGFSIGVVANLPRRWVLRILVASASVVIGC